MFTAEEIREIINLNGGADSFCEIDTKNVPLRNNLTTDLQQLTDDEIKAGYIMGLI